MNEKEFKKIITDETSNSSYKANLNNLLGKLVLNLKDNLNPKITLDNYSFASFEAFGIYTTDKVVNVCLDLNSPIDNKVLESTLFFNSLENALILLKATKLEKTLNGFKTIIDDIEYNIEIKNDIKPTEYIKELVNIIDNASNQYTLLKNALCLVNYFIKSEDIKDIDYKVIVSLFLKNLKLNDIENKYYKYLSVLVKGLEDFTQSKKYELQDVVTKQNLTDTVSELKMNEYRKLRKTLQKVATLEEQKIQFDSQLEVLIDVNPVVNNDQTFGWRYDIVGRGNSNSGGNYPNNEADYQTAVLKGIFKGLKVIIDNNLVKKRIVLLCDYDGILTEKMLSNDENKSRMKTIKSLIEKHNLKVVTRR